MKRNRCAALFALGAVFALSWAAPPAFAAVEDFAACDGFGGPNGAGDGLTSPALNLLPKMFKPLYPVGNTRGDTPPLGEAGIAACDTALVDLQRYPEYDVRKVSVIRARAMHRLSLKDYDGARRDLDLAQAAGEGISDPYYRRSTAVGIDLVRALILRETGDQAGAEALAAKVWEQRPYSRRMQAAVLMAIGPDASPALLDKVYRRWAQLTPELIDVLYLQAIDDGRFADALALYPQLVPPQNKDVEVGYSGYVIEEIEAEMRRMSRRIENLATATLFKARRAAAKAYLLAATGREAEAAALLATTRAEVKAAARTPFTEVAPRTEYASRLFPAYRSAMDGLAREGAAILDRAEALVAVRLLITQGKTNEALGALGEVAIPADGIGRELLTSLAAALPAQAASDRATVKQAMADLERQAGRERQATVVDLFSALPDADTAARVAEYGKVPMIGRNEGFKPSKPDPDGAYQISFEARRSSGSITEEMALLRAAELARQSGKSGFIIRGRTDYERSFGSARSGPPLATGYLTRLDVLPVDRDRPPPGYAQAGWRIFDAEAVYRDLIPIYGPQAAAPARARPR